MRGTYALAGQVVEVTSVYRRVHELLRPYATSTSPDFCICTTEADIAYEHEQSKDLRSRDAGFIDAYLEELAAYRKIAERMPSYGVFLFHGSALAMGGGAYVFTAPSGTGKSTHAALWRKRFGSLVTMVNDDKPLLRVEGTRVLVCGTPWDGKHRLSTNTIVPVRAVCLLEQAGHNWIRQLSPKEAYARLLQQTYRPRDAQALIQTLGLLDVLLANVPLFRMGCTMDIEAAEMAYKTMGESEI